MSGTYTINVFDHLVLLNFDAFVEVGCVVPIVWLIFSVLCGSSLTYDGNHCILFFLMLELFY